MFKKQKKIKEIVESGKPGLYICGAYQFLGNYYKDADGKVIKGLEIFDLYTENPGGNENRLIGNISRECSTLGIRLLGFENHGGRTYLGKDLQPLRKVLKGFGNNGEDDTEGAIYKNSFGTYLHGPILPKNPEFADFLIEKALEIKYKKKITLEKLDDTLEEKSKNGNCQKDWYCNIINTMKVDVSHIAKLANLPLKKDDEKKYEEQLSTSSLDISKIKRSKYGKVSRNFPDHGARKYNHR